MASKEILEEIRSRLSIVSLVGERVPLKKSGRNFKGLCPFHQEKSPSFMVNEEKQIFHCFGCATGGDIFAFLMKLDGLTFPEVLEELAKKAGVKLPAAQKLSTPDADAEWTRRKKWAFRLNQIANDFFVKNLEDEKQGLVARNYLKSRGIRTETATQHFLGCADKSWDALLGVLTAAKAPLKLAEELGLIKPREKEGGYYDFFRGRLMFPIMNIKGEIAGFSGRILGGEEGAKYLNSPDSLLYNKSQIVFGLNWAKDTIRNLDEVILVEGNLDLISLRQAGIGNVVAPLGTALTIDHLRLLMRYTRNFVLAFDGDEAGMNAAFRSLSIFLELGLVPKALVLPSGMDPDSFIRQEGVEEWAKLKAKAPTLFEYFVDGVICQTGKGTAAKVRAWEKIKPLFQKVVNPLEQGIYGKQVAEKLGVEESWLKKGLGTLNQGLKTENERSITSNKQPEYPEEEKLLLAAMILKPKVLQKIQEAGEVFSSIPLKNLAEQLFLQYAEEGSIRLAVIQNNLEGNLASWIREMALVEEEDNVWEKAVEDCLAKIRGKTLGSRLNNLNQEIVQAEMEGNEMNLLKLLAEKSKLMETELKKRTQL